MNSRLEFLRQHRGDHALMGLPVGPLPAYLAVDANGGPGLAVPAASKGRPQVLETEFLTLRLYADVSITDIGNTQISGIFHLLTCKKNTQDVIGPFEALATGLAESLHSLDEVDNTIALAFETLCELFRTRPLGDLVRARTGLWAELFVMREMGGFQRLAPFWHTEPKRLFDLSSGPYRLEVKATTHSERTHVFTHRQLFTEDKLDIVIASTLLVHDDSGLALSELVSEARAALKDNPSAILKLEKAVRLAGMADSEDSGPAYGAGEARRNLQFYRAEQLPHFPMSEPGGVSETTYRVSLSNIAPVPIKLLRHWLSQWG